jgi:hypothetical protein
MVLLSNQKIGSLCKINHIDLSQSKKIKLLGLGIKAGLTVSILRNRAQLYRGLCKNRNDWQNPIFAQLVISLNLVLAGLRLGLKKSPSG